VANDTAPLSRTNDAPWLDVADVINGVIVRHSGVLARVIEVLPMSLELMPTEEVAVLLDKWRRLAKGHDYQVDIRLSTRPQRAEAYLARLQTRATALEASARTVQHQRLAVLCRSHERWLRGEILPASRQRHVHWWPWVDPLADWSLSDPLPARGRAAAATVEHFHAGVKRLDAQTGKVRALLDALKLQHHTLDHDEVLAYLHAETHPS
jgi:hypothetical protein